MDEEFARAVYRDFVIEQVEERLRGYSAARPEDIKDPSYAAAAGLYRELDGDQQAAFAAAMRLAAVDALARLFSVIQGFSSFGSFDGAKFSLRYGTVELGRDIADLFLLEDEKVRARG